LGASLAGDPVQTVRHSLKPPVRGGAAKDQGEEPKSGQFAIRPLSQTDFAARCLSVIFAMAIVNSLIPQKIIQLKAAGQWQTMWFVHATLILINIASFWYVTRIVVGRFLDLFRLNSLPKPFRIWLRLSLLSPLMGLQTIGLAFVLPQAFFKDKRPWRKYLVLTLALTLCVHCSYLLWRVARGDIARSPGTMQLSKQPQGVSSKVTQDLYWTVRNNLLDGEWLTLHRVVEVHVLPYLSPALHIGFAAGTDYLRLKTMESMSRSDQRSRLCPKPSIKYLGAQVENCFVGSYEKLNVVDPFLTPAMVLAFEMRRIARDAEENVKMIANDQPGGALSSPDSLLAKSILSIENSITLLDPGHYRLSIAAATSPQGLLPYIGNFELPFLQMSRDVQQFFTVQYMGDQFAPQIREIQMGLKLMGSVMSAEALKRCQEKLNELEARLKSYKSRPF